MWFLMNHRVETAVWFFGSVDREIHLSENSLPSIRLEKVIVCRSSPKGTTCASRERGQRSEIWLAYQRLLSPALSSESQVYVPVHTQLTVCTPPGAGCLAQLTGWCTAQALLHEPPSILTARPACPAFCMTCRTEVGNWISNIPTHVRAAYY